MLNYSAPPRRCLQTFCAKHFPWKTRKPFWRKKFTNSKSFSIYYISRVSFIFGAITMTAGIIGVPLGSYLSTKLSKTYPRSDPVICAIGLLVSAPLIGASMIVVTANSTLAYLLVFLGEVALNCNWAIVADMLLVRLTSFALIVPSNFLWLISLFILIPYLIILQNLIRITLPFKLLYMCQRNILLQFLSPTQSHFIHECINGNEMELVKWQKKLLSLCVMILHSIGLLAVGNIFPLFR